jgi:RNA-binding protein
MGQLSGKELRAVRKAGQHERVLAQVGKDGLTDGLVEQVGALLARRELVKVRLPGDPAAARHDMARALSDRCAATCAAEVGRCVLLYRPNPDLPPDKRLLRGPER